MNIYAVEFQYAYRGRVLILARDENQARQAFDRLVENEKLYQYLDNDVSEIEPLSVETAPDEVTFDVNALGLEED